MLKTESQLLVLNICCDHSKYAAARFHHESRLQYICLPVAPAIPFMAAEKEKRRKEKKKPSKGHKLWSVLQPK